MAKIILIIEDEADIANVFQKQLTMIGDYEVEIATDGKVALEMLKKNKYDLALLDLIMPIVDGIEVLKAVTGDPEKYHGTPVIVLTNVTSEETQQQALALGAVKYIVKTDANLVAAVNEFFSDK